MNDIHFIKILVNKTDPWGHFQWPLLAHEVNEASSVPTPIQVVYIYLYTERERVKGYRHAHPGDRLQNCAMMQTLKFTKNVWL